MDPNNLNSGADQKHLTKSVKKLQKDFKNLLLLEDHSDVALKVAGEKFKVHRSILSARSAYFSSLFRKEKKTDFPTEWAFENEDPNVFRNLLEYIYTGKISFSPDSIVRLFFAADRYQVHELKEECVRAIGSNLSKDNFCDYWIMSLKHPEMNLIEILFLYFRDNVPDIISTSKWKKFMKENSESCNILFYHALKKAS